MQLKSEGVGLFSAGFSEMFHRGENGAAERRSSSLLALLLDALLFVAAGIQIEGEVRPLVAGREGDGLAQGEAHGVNDALAAGLGGAHADA